MLGEGVDNGIFMHSPKTNGWNLRTNPIEHVEKSSII